MPGTGYLGSVRMTALANNSSLRPRWQVEVGEPVVALDVLPGGPSTPDSLVAGGSEGVLRVFDPDGTLRYERDLDDALLAIAASPDATRIAALGMGSLRLWGATDGAVLHSEGAGWSASAAWDRRSQYLAVADGRRVRVLDRSGTTRWSSAPLTSTVTNVLWPRGRRRVAASTYRGVTIFEPETGRITNTLDAPGAISGLTAAPNGRWVVGGSQDATLHGWKVADGSDFRMSGFPATVSQLAFEDGGRWLACESAEVLTCWDFSGAGPTGRPGVVLTGHQSAVTAFAWVPGHRQTLISGDQDGNVLVWRIGPATKPGHELRPVGGARDDDPVTAIIVDHTGPATVYIGRRSGRVDALAIS
ncbi:WD40 repeat domain-containing protein [Saccharopolyspora sp. 5N708]|uniref:WD40 repeat domain-containing protein n=1 Tax=Saccharopolyspora sp. 5N708 TaxID=3457424 RepID=UPI003FD54E93